MYEAKWLRKLRQRICTPTTVQILEACKTISILRFFEFSIEDFTTCSQNKLMVDGSVVPYIRRLTEIFGKMGFLHRCKA